MTELDPETLDRALGYPYERPPGAFRYWPALDRVEPIRSVGASADRAPVLAIGSNAAPVQLRRKFGGHPSGRRPIEVVPAMVRDHDVVHAAMVARYGSVPATLVARPGTTCHVHVTLLDPPQLDHMHETEGLGSAYQLVRLDPRLVEAPVLGALSSVEAYVATAGPMLVHGTPVALAAIGADGRDLPAWHQAAVLEHLAHLMEMTVPQLVSVTTTDEAARRAAARLLR